MKCNATVRKKNLMSAVYTLKLRVFTLVMCTGQVINERTTPTLGMAHAIASPLAIFTTFIFIGIMVVGATRKIKASVFLQAYASLTCSGLHMYLSITVFKELTLVDAKYRQSGLVLNGVLPMLLIFIFISDLIVTLFSCRRQYRARALFERTTPDPTFAF